MTRENALKLAGTKFWEKLSDYKIVKFQLFTEKLCMPFDIFHKALEKVLKRPVYTHEFAYADSLRAEFLGKKKSPTFQEILDLIPQEKRILVINKR